MSAIEIARQDLSISQLRAEAARTADAKQARRILPLPWCWMVIRGCWPRRPVPWTGRRYATGASLQRGWLGRLADRPRPGRQLVCRSQRSEVAKWVEDGLTQDRWVVRWRCADLRDRIAAKFNVHLHERSVGKLLKKLNFSSMSVRPVHPQSDLRHRRLLKKTSLSWRAPQSAGACRPAGRNLVSG